tara:strand:+ start:939 stop:1193 length:255 start_codon:yes stop_codon:yes gene_type:complete
MILYTEKQLDNLWQLDCKNRSSKDKPWLGREKYRELFEACLDLKIAGLDDRVEYYLKTFDLQLPVEIIDYIQDEIDLELEEDEH